MMEPLTREQFITQLNDAIANARMKQCADISGILFTDAALRERLEMDYGFDSDGNRVAVPGIPDGIECRDATIRLIECANAELKQQLAQARQAVWEEAAKDLAHGLPGIWKDALVKRCAFKAAQAKKESP